jgi:hypothetical protein
MSLVEEEVEAEAVEEAVEAEEEIRTQINLWATTRGMMPPIRRQALDNQHTTQTIIRVLYAEVPQTYSMERGTRWTRSCKPSGCIEQSIVDTSR